MLTHLMPRHPQPKAYLCLILFLAATVTGCSTPFFPDKTIDYTAVDAKNSGKQLPHAEFYAVIAEADYVLLGELHGNKEHHRLQLEVVNQLLTSGRKPALVFEMFDQQQQSLINQVVESDKPNANRVAKAVDWKNSGWPKWRLYRPLVKAALDNDLTITAGNLSRADAFNAVKKIADGEEPASQIPESLMGFSLEDPLPTPDFSKLKKLLSHSHSHSHKHQGHGQSGSESAEQDEQAKRFSNGMYFAQRLRDATLAQSMLSNTDQGAVLIAGRQHTRLDYGVPYYLKLKQPNKKIISVAFSTKDKLELLELNDKTQDSTPILDYVLVYD